MIGGVRQPTSDRVDDLGCRLRGRAGFKRGRSAGLLSLRRMRASGFRTGEFAVVNRLGSLLA